ncbi:iron-sulfur cluster repair di-iron protein [Aquisalimonas lutea]|uniref:iron-sulfur cluster repair di-iron protein n=1 Tax=Aquisalimonas lutea TaxID=1327750 RepID=UPI0025B2E42F|nr:iron-sulfur cluster repair di-iron protein [Aquisalimonas lutea]MDN3519755.1 iron-sulfur cluster repair di-iron protein [Aquisalimonas lutea]
MEHQANPSDLTRHTLGEIAANIPGATRVFREYDLDFCCGGSATLDSAARERGIDPAEVQRQLAALSSGETADSDMDTGALVDHILTRYHHMHRKELPELIRLALKVESVHGSHPEVPAGLGGALEEIQQTLDAHMHDEEVVLFPYAKGEIRDLSGEVFTQLEQDHRDHGETLRKVEMIANGFRPPRDACRTWQALYAGTAKFVNDVREHVHLENNVLFPRLRMH